MNQQPDKLFRDKLENYQRTVPVSAWDKIAATQEKKKPYRAWLKIAASLLLIAVAGIAWVLMQRDTTSTTTLAGNQAITQNAPQPSANAGAAPSVDPGQTDAAVNARPLNPDGKTAGSAVNTGAAGTTNIRSKQANRHASPVTKTAEPDQRPVSGDANGIAMRSTGDANNDPLGTSLVPSVTPQEAKPEPTADLHATTTVASAAPVQRVTLNYTTEDVSAYLNINTDNEATDDDKKQSTLKKLLQKANDLKTNQDPIGELRQRKNEILALNFKNDKRGQKTRN